MKEDFRFINEVVRIINGALRLDIDKVRNYTAFLAEKLDGAGDKGTADQLRKMLQESDRQLRPADVNFGRVLPVDAESRFPLVEHVKVKEMAEPALYLEQAEWDVVNEFISVCKTYGTAVDPHDSAGALSFLMYGLPGTGKSRLARHIARELGMDLYVARLDGLISSYLGSTSKNIRALFDFAAKTPCVLFLDEFDAIAKLRGDNQELGELKRVVNSFIQNLDTLGRQSILLAATNHESLLDAAVWRRFTYRLALELPSTQQRALMWQDFIKPADLTERSVTLLADLTEGFSGSDIREACMRLKRQRLAHGADVPNEPITLSKAFPILMNLSLNGGGGRFASSLVRMDQAALVKALRERNQRLYSFANLGELLGLSKATVQRLAPKEIEDHG
jgi:hypothetical protein